MAVESVGVGWGTCLLLLILAGGVFCAIFFPCRRAAAKRAAQRRLEALHALDALVLAAPNVNAHSRQRPLRFSTFPVRRRAHVRTTR